MASLIGDQASGKEDTFMIIQKRIEETFSIILLKVVERRQVLLEQLLEWKRDNEAVMTNLEEMNSSKQEMERMLSRLTLETAKKSLEKTISDLSHQISEETKKASCPDVSFVCEANDLEWRISQLGELSKTKKEEIHTVKNYEHINEPFISFGNAGSGLGEFYQARGVVADEDNKRIFVADLNGSIQVWTMDGEYIWEFGVSNFACPWELVLLNNMLYVSDFENHIVTKWCTNTFRLITTTKLNQRSNEGQLQRPAGLAIDCEEVFVVECSNRRISVFDLNLSFKRIMAVQMIYLATCLRIRSNIIFVIESEGTVKLFSKDDQLVSSIDRSQYFSNYVYHFTFDSAFNFLITDAGNNSLVILSPEGELLGTLCFGYSVGEPFGIDVMRNGNLIISFQNGSATVVVW